MGQTGFPWGGCIERFLKSTTRLSYPHRSRWQTLGESNDANTLFQHLAMPSMKLDARSRFFSINELLSLVFEYCLPEENLPTDNPRVAPIVLTHVCRSWHDVARATPQLWTRVCLVCFPSISCRMLADRHVDILSGSLARSGSFPTSLTLRYLGSSASDVRNISKILNVVLPHSCRWREMSVTAPMPCLQPILERLGRSTPVLETCRISITSASTLSEREDLVVDLDNSVAFRLNAVTLDLSDALKLRDLNLKTDALTDVIFVGLPSSLVTINLDNFDLLLGPSGLAPNLRCYNLRKLALRSHIQLNLLRQFAQAFPFLEEAVFNIKVGLESELFIGRHRACVAFAKLQSLTLRAISASGTADLQALGLCLEALDAPLLRHLSLTVSFAILQHTWLPLSGHLSRVHPPLREFSFVGACLTEHDFLDIVRQAPQLESLKTCVRLSDRVLTELTLREESRPREDAQASASGLCPHLKYMDIPLASPCSANSVIAMILSRCTLPHSRVLVVSDKRCSRPLLEECRLVLSTPGAVEQVEQHPEVIQCVEQGLKLDLRAF